MTLQRKDEIVPVLAAIMQCILQNKSFLRITLSIQVYVKKLSYISWNFTEQNRKHLPHSSLGLLQKHIGKEESIPVGWIPPALNHFSVFY